MASVKGIVVEIGGDTSGLQEALKKVNKQTSSLSKELKGINSLLKLDPKNTELLAQKQKVLGDEIKSVETALKNLKAQAEDYAKRSGELSEEDQKKYRAIQREIVATEDKLKNLKFEASSWNTVSKKLEEIGNKFTEIGDKVENLGKKLSVVSAGTGALLGVGVKLNADIETATKSFEAFIGSAEEAEQAIANIRSESKTSPFGTKELIKANQMLIATGISAEDSQKTISALADAIALTGGGNDELTRMASNLQQIQNARKSNVNGY